MVCVEVGMKILHKYRFTRRILAYIRKVLSNRKLKKSHCSTWENYRHSVDADVCFYADRVSDFYKGYEYLFACHSKHYAYTLLYDYGPGGYRYGYHEMQDWCHEKIRWDFRCDCHRVYETNEGKMMLNDIGGIDIMYFAFKREQDFTHFLLRWS